MKRYCPFARYKDNQENEGFDYWDTFSQAKNAVLRLKDLPHYQCFNLWGIDVFDTKKEDFTHHYILVNDSINGYVFQLRSS